MSGSEIFDAIQEGNGDKLAALLSGDAGLAAVRNEAGVSAVRMTLYYRRPELTDLLLRKDPPLEAYRAVSFYRQRHHLFSCAFLAGRPAWGRLPHTDRGTGAWFPDRQRRQDVQIAWYFYHRQDIR